MKKSQKQFAVITGASQGLGKAFVHELASRGKNLVLISLPDQGLSELAEEVSREYGVETAYYETDLSVFELVLNAGSWINKNFEVNLLINNAGVGGSKKFMDASVDYINSILQVNMMATSILTHSLLPNLMKQDQSYVLNISSLAAFSPIGNKTVYPASKAFIHFFARSLYAELAGTNVFVSVVNPGPMNTNEEISRRIKAQGIIGKLTLMSPGKVARISVNRLYKKDTVIMVNPISWFFLKIIPVWIRLPIMTRAVERELIHA